MYDNLVSYLPTTAPVKNSFGAQTNVCIEKWNGTDEAAKCLKIQKKPDEEVKTDIVSTG